MEAICRRRAVRAALAAGLVAAALAPAACGRAGTAGTAQTAGTAAGAAGTAAGAAGTAAGAAGTVAGVAAPSCAGPVGGRAGQLAGARFVVVGQMLAGPVARAGVRRVLVSPARMRVERYLRGHGPAVVGVQTAVTRRGGTVAIAEDGIEPLPGQRWEIVSGSARPPLATSICAGSRALPAHTM